MSWMEMEVTVEDLVFNEASFSHGYYDHFIKTWQMIDDNPDVDPDSVPLYKYGQAFKKAHELIDCFDPHWYVVGKIKLYKKIKAEGFDPERKVRMTCSFYDDIFCIHNGHHRLSMLKHWGTDKVKILVKIPASQGSKPTKKNEEKEETRSKMDWKIRRHILTEHQWYGYAPISLEEGATPMGVVEEETPIYPWSRNGQQWIEKRRILLYMLPAHSLVED